MTEKFGDFLKRVHTYELSKWNLKDLKVFFYNLYKGDSILFCNVWIQMYKLRST